MSRPTQHDVREFLEGFIDNEDDDPIVNAVLVIDHTVRIVLESDLLDRVQANGDDDVDPD
jgi:hypothetical protein